MTDRDHLTQAVKKSYEMILINFRCNRKSYLWEQLIQDTLKTGNYITRKYIGVFYLDQKSTSFVYFNEIS